MKPLLWTVLVVSGLVNGTSTLTTDGAAQTVVSVVTGVVALAAATGMGARDVAALLNEPAQAATP